MMPYEYFESHPGMGVFSTCDAAGRVNAAVYSPPHVQQDGLMVFLLASRRSWQNLQEHPQAHYLYKEDAPGWQGRRFTLELVRTDDDPELLRTLCRRCPPVVREGKDERHAAFFRVVDCRPLVGDDEGK